ncbi:MAG: type II secretion system F family protein [Gallionella sp.]|nr:type II secretion system F family protein [Gallionella sp.]
MRYQVKALREPNEIISFEIEASDELAARRQAGQQGHAVLSVKPAPLAFTRFSKTKFPTLLFSQELLALLSAGLSLVEAIETIVEKEQRQGSRQILDAVLLRLHQGQSLSTALDAFPAEFPALYVATVRASEHTGDLPEALKRYIAYREQADRVRGKIVSASIYPVALLVVGGLVLLFLMFFVIPRFSRIYDDIRGDIPLLSRLLLEWGRLLEAHWAWVGLATAACLVLAVYVALLPRGRAWIVGMLMKNSVLRERAKIFQLARLYRTLGMLLHGGIPLLQSIGMASGLLGVELRAQLGLAAEKIREGQPLSRAMEEHGLTTPVASRLLRVGERSGRMGEMMERIAAFHDDDMARWVDWFTRLFEPALMTLIGIAIGGVVILMYMPIFELAGSIQ